jgi:O-antigen ligase
MNSAEAQRLLPGDWLLLALIALLPLMKPAVRYPVIFADLVFVLLLIAVAVEVAAGRRTLRWHPLFAILAIYVLALAPSMLASANPGRSAFKMATELYLAGLSAVTVVVVRSEAMLRHVTITWLAASAALAILCLASLAAFAISPASALYQYSVFYFGTLPPGHYPRMALSFFDANMACNYLTVALGLLLLAWQQKWLSRTLALLLLAGILIAALPTISPGLGGVALALGTAAWLLMRSRLAIGTAVAGALAFIVALAVTPILHPTAPFLIHVPGTRLILAPAGRLLTWSSAFDEFLRHPWLGHGIGLDAAFVRYRDPSGNLQELTDAHNVFLNIAAQAGVVGLAGLAALIAYAVRLTFSRAIGGSPKVRLVLGLTLLNALVYQGLGVGIEDTRHIWVLLGLLAAASLIPADESNRKAGVPSPC